MGTKVSTIPIRRVLLEGLPIAVLLGVAGILFGFESLAWIVLAPLALGLGAAVAELSVSLDVRTRFMRGRTSRSASRAI
jgi:hypothetical protein